MTDEQFAKVIAELFGIRVALERQAAAVEKSVAARTSPAARGDLTDEDLDRNPAHNPVIRKEPPRWTGADRYAGKTMSLASAPYLEELANFYEWKAEMSAKDAAKATDAAEKAKQEKYARYGLLDAKRARAWARRIRGGWKAPAPEPEKDWRSSATSPAPTPPPSEPSRVPTNWDEDE